MFLVILSFLRRHKATILSHLFTVILTVFTTLAVDRWTHRVDVDVTTPTKDTTVVTVKTDELTPKVIEKIVYVEDKKEIARLLAENKKLKAKVTELTESYASLKSQGVGKVDWVLTNTVPEGLRPAVPTERVTRFKDWRLDFVSDGQNAKYTLTQKFEILTSSGHGKDGKPFSRVKLFEVGPGNTRTPATDVKTTVVVVDETQSRWFFSPSIQIGIGISADVYKSDTRTPGAIVGVQWLKRGRTKSAEDSTWSVLTPVVVLTDKQREIGILPFSFNTGRIPYNPFRDLWVSPYLGTNGDKTFNRIGFVITATF